MGQTNEETGAKLILANNHGFVCRGESQSVCIENDRSPFSLFKKGFFENACFEALLKLGRTKILRLRTNCLNATTELFFFAHDSDFSSSGDNSPLVAFTETWKNFPARWFPQNAGLLCPEQIEGGAVCRWSFLSDIDQMYVEALWCMNIFIQSLCSVDTVTG